MVDRFSYFPTASGYFPAASVSHAARRPGVVRRLRAAFSELNDGLRESSHPASVTTKAAFGLLDRVRTLTEFSAHVFAPTERSEIERVFRAYGRAFDAIATADAGLDGRVRPDAFGTVRFGGDIEHLVADAEAAAAALCQVLADDSAVI